MHDHDMTVTEELIDVYNKRVSSLIDDDAWQLPTIDEPDPEK